MANQPEEFITEITPDPPLENSSTTADEKEQSPLTKKLNRVLDDCFLEEDYIPNRVRQRDILDKIPQNIVQILQGHIASEENHSRNLWLKKHGTLNGYVPPEDKALLMGEVFELVTELDVLISNQIPTQAIQEMLSIMHNPERYEQNIHSVRNPDLAFIHTNTEGQLVIEGWGECKVGMLHQRAIDQLNGGIHEGFVKMCAWLDQKTVTELREAHLTGLADIKEKFEKDHTGQHIPFAQVASNYEQTLIVPAQAHTENPANLVKDSANAGLLKGTKIVKGAFSYNEVKALSQFFLGEIEQLRDEEDYNHVAIAEARDNPIKGELQIYKVTADLLREYIIKKLSGPKSAKATTIRRMPTEDLFLLWALEPDPDRDTPLQLTEDKIRRVVSQMANNKLGPTSKLSDPVLIYIDAQLEESSELNTLHTWEKDRIRENLHVMQTVKNVLHGHVDEPAPEAKRQKEKNRTAEKPKYESLLSKAIPLSELSENTAELLRFYMPSKIKTPKDEVTHEEKLMEIQDIKHLTKEELITVWFLDLKEWKASNNDTRFLLKEPFASAVRDAGDIYSMAVNTKLGVEDIIQTVTDPVVLKAIKEIQTYKDVEMKEEQRRRLIYELVALDQAKAYYHGMVSNE